MIKKGSLYCASDKAFFDALCQHKMSKSALNELFWSRGIIQSKKKDKEASARYFSRLNHDYYDHKFISEKVSTGSNKEKKSTVFTEQTLPLTDIEVAVKDLIESRSEIDNSIDFKMFEKSIEIDVAYSYYDHNQPEFKQLITKTAKISIESSDDGLSIRSPDNEYVSEITSSLLANIEDKSEEGLETETISLHGITDADIKTKFFEDLISNLEDLTLSDVSDISVYNPETDAEEDIGVRIKKASLNGEGLLKSGELKQFYKKGFFVYKISWSMTEKNTKNPSKYHFQAQFNDPEVCKNFSYIVKGFTKFLDKGEYARSQSPLTPYEETRLMRKLERSAKAAKKAVFTTDDQEVEDAQD